MKVSVDTTPSPDLVKLHAEIASLNSKAMEDNAKILVLQEEKVALEEEKRKLLQGNKESHSNARAKEEVTEPWSPVDQITHDIAEISMKEVEVGRLKSKNSSFKKRNSELQQEIEEIKSKDPREQKIIKLKEDKDKLEENIIKLKEKVKEVLPLEGAKHFLWDELSEDIHAFRP